MSARHRCARCKNTFSRREQLEYHLTHTCSDEARAKRRRDDEELSARLAAHERALVELDRDRESRRQSRRQTPVFGLVLQIFDFSEIFGANASGGGVALNPPDLIEARRNDDGSFDAT